MSAPAGAVGRSGAAMATAGRWLSDSTGVQRAAGLRSSLSADASAPLASPVRGDVRP